MSSLIVDMRWLPGSSSRYESKLMSRDSALESQLNLRGCTSPVRYSPTQSNSQMMSFEAPLRVLHANITVNLKTAFRPLHLNS